MSWATAEAEPAGQRLGEGEFPQSLDHVSFGAFLLAVIWAPVHRLWGWFGVFVLLEALESAMGLGAPGFLGGVFEQPAVVAGFRVVYWTVTVAFALRANRLVWSAEQKRAARMRSESVPPRPLVSKYVSNQRAWTIVGLVLLAASPLSLLLGSLRSAPGAVADVAVTVGTQAILLVGLFVHDRARNPRRQPQS